MIMNKKRACAIIYFVAAVLADIAALIYFIGPSQYLGWMCLGVGSTLLCLGSIYLNQYQKEKNESDTPENENEK